jgi:hypothetical protein
MTSCYFTPPIPANNPASPETRKAPGHVPLGTAALRGIGDAAVARTVDSENDNPNVSTTGAMTMKLLAGIAALAIVLISDPERTGNLLAGVGILPDARRLYGWHI